ncbi:MAG: hypothetical protein K2X47_10355, partial [Bdellovibrionales bacterium]|nr:hypothetical protein [Bdellovibrionales bacterium]
LVHHKAHAWLEGGIVDGKPTPTIDGWIADLQELAKLLPRNTMVYGGRGVSANLETVIPEQIRYLQLAREMIRRGLRAMGPKAKDFNGPKAPALYKSLAEHFQSTFSGYVLSYMIEYGAYGLVQQELKKSM